MHSAILFGSGVLAGVCLLGLVLTIRDVPRAERDAQRIHNLEREASQYAQAWARMAQRGKRSGSGLAARLAQAKGGNSAA